MMGTVACRIARESNRTTRESCLPLRRRSCDGGSMISRQRNAFLAIAVAAFALAASACEMGPAATGAFDRSFTVKTAIRLELSNASGNVSITGSSDDKVHVH